MKKQLKNLDEEPCSTLVAREAIPERQWHCQQMLSAAVVVGRIIMPTAIWLRRLNCPSTLHSGVSLFP